MDALHEHINVAHTGSTLDAVDISGCIIISLFDYLTQQRYQVRNLEFENENKDRGVFV